MTGTTLIETRARIARRLGTIAEYDMKRMDKRTKTYSQTGTKQVSWEKKVKEPEFVDDNLEAN
jgi:hypothetical protein